MRRSSLPSTIQVKGETLHLVVGAGQPEIIAQAKAAKKLYRHVTVYNKNLVGKIDLHNKPYPESSFLFVEDYTPYHYEH